MARPGPLLDRLNTTPQESESLSEAATRMGAFAQQQSLEVLTALAGAPSPEEAASMASRAAEHADVLATEVERFLALVPKGA